MSFVNNFKVLSLLGLANRARLVVIGEDLVLGACKKHPGNLVFLASDAGDNIRKKMVDKSNSFDLTLVQTIASDDLSKALGKQHVKVVLVKDEGFSKRMKELLNS